MIASVAFVGLLVSTWLIVDLSLKNTGTAIVSAGRTGFTVLGLVALTWWSTAHATRPNGHSRDSPSDQSSTRRYRWWQVALLAFTGVTAYTLLSTAAIGFAGPALPTLIMSLTPAVVLVAESVLSRTRPASVTILGTAVAVAGAVLYVGPRLSGSAREDTAMGAACAVGAMLSMSFYGVYFARLNRGFRGAMAPRILPVFALGTIPLAIWAISVIAAGESVGWSTVGLLAVLGIVIYVPVYHLQHRLLLTNGPSYVALLGLWIPPLVGAASTLLHLAEPPGPLQIIATVLTLLGTVLVVRRTLQPAQPSTNTGQAVSNQKY